MSATPFDQRDGWIWYDGQIVPWKDAQLHVLSHGLHYGSSVFEGERAYGGEIFKSTEHSERLKKSGQILDFEIPYTVAEIDAAKRLVLQKNGMRDAYLRPVAWRGSEMMGVAAQDNKIHLAIAAWEWPSYFDPAQKMKGIRIDMAEYRRPDPATAPPCAWRSCRSCRDRPPSRRTGPSPDRDGGIPPCRCGCPSSSGPGRNSSAIPTQRWRGGSCWLEPRRPSSPSRARRPGADRRPACRSSAARGASPHRFPPPCRGSRNRGSAPIS